MGSKRMACEDMRLVLEFTAGECNGLMDLAVILPNDEIKPAIVQGHNSISLLVTPGKLRLETSGKDMRYDTVVDAEGTVIRDKHINITSMTLEGLRFDWNELNDLFFLPYIGTNTSKEIEIPSRDSLIRWYLRLKEKYNVSKRG